MNRLRLLAVLAALLGPAPTLASELPDPARFGARMELGDIGQARRWLDAGLDPNFVADRIGTGLMIGAWTGNIELMALFVARGANIHRTNGRGETALMHAAWKGRIEAVKWLLARGAQANGWESEWSALHYSAFSGHGEIAQLLLERGADINARSPNGSSVLMMAIYEGHDDVARLLLARGADHRIRNERGDSALDWAIKYQRGDIARLVGSAQEVAVAASQPKNVVAQRSQPGEADSIEELLRIRRHLETRGLSLGLVDQRTAAMRARDARAALARERQARMPVLEITARRGRPDDQGVQLIWR
jgi:hypothetical protein